MNENGGQPSDPNGPDPSEQRSSLQSALTQAAAKEPSYAVPPHLTPAARRDFDRAVQNYADGLAVQVERTGLNSRKPGQEPEYNTDTVDKAIRIHHVTIGLDTDETPSSVVPGAHSGPDLSEEDGTGRDWGPPSIILSTIATVGIGVMPNFLHSFWQWGLFSFFILVGCTGLLATWKAHRSARKGRRRSDHD